MLWHCFVIIIIRPHCSPTYVDRAYCYRPSTTICRSVSLSVTVVSLVRNRVLDGGPDPHKKSHF